MSAPDPDPVEYTMVFMDPAWIHSNPKAANPVQISVDRNILDPVHP